MEVGRYGGREGEKEGKKEGRKCNMKVKFLKIYLRDILALSFL
jgi:hypothetical protein